jgi:O-antigen/teichoic acid export membrane protein
MRSFQQIVLVIGSKSLSLGALFLAGILVARIVGPVGFGYYNAGLTLLLLVDALVGQPLDNAMVRFNSLHGDEEHSVDTVQGRIFRIKMLFGLALVCAAFFFSGTLTPLLLDADAPRYLLLVAALGALFLLAARSTSCFLQMRQWFRGYAAMDALQGGIRILGVGVFFVMGIRNPEAYLAIYGAGALAAFTVFFITVPQRYVTAESPNRVDAQRIFAYVGATSAIVMLGTITGRADILLLMQFGGPEMAGLYSAAAQLAFLGALLAGYMAIVFQPKVVQLSRDGHLGKMIRLNVAAAAGLSLLCVPVALWVLPWLMPLLFGEGFTASVPILQILLIGTCADLFVMPILLPFSIQVLAKETLLGELAITILFFGIVFAGSNMTAWRMAWILSSIRVMKFGMYLFIVVRHLHHQRIKNELQPSAVA